MHFSVQMFWQCEDVANMCLWDDPVAILGVASGQSEEILGRTKGSSLLFCAKDAHVHFWEEGLPYVGFLSMEIYEIHPASSL